MLPFVRMLEYGNIAPSIHIKQCVVAQINLGVLYSTGEYYMHGTATNGVLGTGSTSYKNSWYRTLTDCRLVALNANFNVVIKNDNTVWHVGNRRCLDGTTASINAIWTDVTSMFSSIDIGTVIDMQVTNYGIMLLLSDGTIYGVGYTPYWEFGSNKTVWNVLTRLSTESTITKICCDATATGFICNNGNTWYRAGYCGVPGEPNAYRLGASGNVKNYTAFTLSPYRFVDCMIAQDGSFLLGKNPSTGKTVLIVAGQGDVGYFGNGTGIYSATYTAIEKTANLMSSLKVKSSLIQQINFGMSIDGIGILCAGNGSNYCLGTNSTSNVTTYSKKVIGFSDIDTSKVLSINPLYSYGTFMVYDGKLYCTGNGTGLTTFIGVPLNTVFTLVPGMPY